jgi:hypothetical protein
MNSNTKHCQTPDSALRTVASKYIAVLTEAFFAGLFSSLRPQALISPTYFDLFDGSA